MSEGGLVMQIERQAAVIESLRAELEDELAAEHLKRDSEIRHYDAKWKEFNVQLGVEKARAEKAEARIAELEKDRDELKKRASDTLGTVCRLMSDGEELEQERDNLRAALDAADRFAEMVRQHAAQHAGHHASSDITTVDIRQEYEFYQEALATVGKAGE